MSTDVGHAASPGAEDSTTSGLGVTVIRPSQGWVALNLRELWEYRELLYFLTWRDVKVRYKQAALGVAWAVIQPAVTMAIFTVVFGRLAGLPSDGLPYPVFTLAALLPWQLLAGSIQRTGTCLVGNANLLTKVYFPRLIIPMSAVLACLVDFGISFGALLVLMLYYGIAATPALMALPIFTLMTLGTALSLGLWLSALNVRYRDVGYLIPFLVQVWMYASPVAYSVTLVPEGPWRLLYGLNPMVGVIQGFRWALLGGRAPDGFIAVSAPIVVLLLITGLFYFRRTERTFADVV